MTRTLLYGLGGGAVVLGLLAMPWWGTVAAMGVCAVGLWVWLVRNPDGGVHRGRPL